MPAAIVTTEERSRMRRYAPVVIALVAAMVVVACSDVPAPTSKGNRAIEGTPEEVADAAPAPQTEDGVVPDLFEVTLTDSKKALTDAGFKKVEADTASVFGTVSGELLVCEQDPEAGASPPSNTPISLTVDRSCGDPTPG
jgi:hypothetical protein